VYGFGRHGMTLDGLSQILVTKRGGAARRIESVLRGRARKKNGGEGSGASSNAGERRETCETSRDFSLGGGEVVDREIHPGEGGGMQSQARRVQARTFFLFENFVSRDLFTGAT